MKKIYLTLSLGALLVSVSPAVFSQNVSINTTGTAAEQSAILDLSNGNVAGTVGFLPPYVSLTTSTAFLASGTAATSAGIIVYNTSANLDGPGLYTWSSASNSWIFLGSGISGSGSTNYLARWGTATSLTYGIAQDNGLEDVISQTGSAFGYTSLLTVVAPASTETSAILGMSQVAGSYGITGGNSVAGAGSVGVEGYVGTIATPAASVGVYGISNGATGNQIGVQGTATGATTKDIGGAFSATGTTANVGAQISATGGATNYAIIVPATSGNVGFGNIAPAGSSIVDFTNTNAPDALGAPIVWPVNTSTVTASIGTPVNGEEFYNSATGCFDFYNATLAVWQVAGCPCTAAPAVITPVPSCTKPFGGETVTYSTTIASAVSYNWTAFSNDGSPTISGAGTQTVTITWPTYATTGTVVSTLSNICGTSTASLTTSIVADSMTGPSSLFTSTTNAGLYTMANGSTYTWSITGGTGITLSATNTQSVEVSTGSGSFTIQCVVTQLGGNCPGTYTMAVTTAACTGAITADPNPLSSATTAWTYTSFGRFGGRWGTTPNMTITTTDNNDLVLVALTDQDGGYRFGNINGLTPTGSAVSYTGPTSGTATIYQTVSSFYSAGSNSNGAAPIVIYAFPATIAGTYAITVTEPGNFNNRQEMNFAMAVTGFCSPTIPSISNLLGYVVVYSNSCAGTTGIVSAAFGTACPAGGYLFSCMNNIYSTGDADGVQSYQASGGVLAWAEIQENVGEAGYSNTTASIGGTPESAGFAASTVMEAQDLATTCTTTAVFIIVH